MHEGCGCVDGQNGRGREVSGEVGLHFDKAYGRLLVRARASRLLADLS